MTERATTPASSPGGPGGGSDGGGGGAAVPVRSAPGTMPRVVWACVVLFTVVAFGALSFALVLVNYGAPPPP